MPSTQCLRNSNPPTHIVLKRDVFNRRPTRYELTKITIKGDHSKDYKIYHIDVDTSAPLSVDGSTVDEWASIPSTASEYEFIDD